METNGKLLVSCTDPYQEHHSCECYSSKGQTAIKFVNHHSRTQESGFSKKCEFATIVDKKHFCEHPSVVSQCVKDIFQNELHKKAT